MQKVIGTLSFNRFDIPYRVYGDSAKTIVCLSGAKQTMSAWRSFVSHFQSAYRIVVFDMPGQGRSKILQGAAGVSLDEQVEILHQVILETNTHCSAEKFLIGGSWGSIVAAAYADKYTDTFDRMILGSFGTKANTVLQSVIDDVQHLISLGKGKDIAPVMIEKFGQSIPDTLKRQIVAQFDCMTEKQFQSFYEHSVAVSKMGDLKDLVNLKNIPIPVLVVMGQFDTVMDLFDTRKSTKLLPQGEFKLINGVGHFLHWEQPSILAEYEAFFKEHALAIVRCQAS